jgi:hypothetical protein
LGWVVAWVWGVSKRRGRRGMRRRDWMGVVIWEMGVRVSPGCETDDELAGENEMKNDFEGVVRMLVKRVEAWCRSGNERSK